MLIPCIDKSLNGIFTFLYYNLDKNKYKKEISYWSTPIHEDRGGVSGLIDPTNIGNARKDNFHTINQKNSFVAFHFRTKKITVLNYTLMARNEEESNDKGQYPQTWKLEGSNNNNTWTIIHQQSSTSALTGVGNKLTMKTTVHNAFSSFMLTNMGSTESSSSDFYLVLHRIELFGIINFNNVVTCQRHNRYLYFNCLLINILYC